MTYLTPLAPVRLTTTQRILRGIADLLFPIKRNWIRPQLCRCRDCGQVHYRAVVES